MLRHATLFTIVTLTLAMSLISCGGATDNARGNQPPGSGQPPAGQPPAGQPPGGQSPAQPPKALPETFDVTLVRVGTDPIQEGSVKIEAEEGDNRVRVRAEGATPDTMYAFQFCSFVGGFSACRALGSITVDNEGRIDDRFAFPQRGVFSGVFTLSRNGSNQFITGFTVPEDSSGDDVFREGLQPIAAISDHLGLGAVNSGDSAREARAEVSREGGARAKLEGAPRNVSYSVSFCPFGMGLNSCFKLATLSTNEEGEGHVDFTFPSGTHEGIFLLKRGDTNEFATGFLIR